MRVDIREALGTDGRAGTRRVVLLSVMLAAVAVVVAGVTGTSHLSGPRWYPHISLSQPPAKPTKVNVTTPLAPPSAPASQISLSPFVWIVVGLLAAAAAWWLWRWWMRRPKELTGRLRASTDQTARVVVVPSEPEPDPPALLSGIELALQALDEQRDPSDAIVRAWLGLQQTAEESGIFRHPSETPTEFTTRILSRAFADDTAVRTLLRLYLRTRFGDHPVTDQDVSAVRFALTELMRSWRAGETANPGRG